MTWIWNILYKCIYFSRVMGPVCGYNIYKCDNVLSNCACSLRFRNIKSSSYLFISSCRFVLFLRKVLHKKNVYVGLVPGEFLFRYASHRFSWCDYKCAHINTMLARIQTATMTTVYFHLYLCPPGRDKKHESIILHWNVDSASVEKFWKKNCIIKIDMR